MKNQIESTRPANPFNVGDGATLCGYSDRSAYTVLAVTRTTITLQRDKATLLNGHDSGEEDALTFTPGGFVGHTEGTQRYAYAPDPEGHVLVARMKAKPRKVWEQVSEDGTYGYVLKADFRNQSSRVIAGRLEALREAIKAGTV